MNNKRKDSMLAKTEDLVKEAQKNSSEAFGRLYELYFDRIYRYIYYRTMHRETAEDLCSKTFLKALERLNNFNTKKGSFSAWLYKIASNSVTDYFRSAVRKEHPSDVWEIPSEEDYVVDVHNRIYWEKLKPALMGLPADKREIIMLRIWDELSFAEIARITGKSEASCKMSFGRTLKHLKDNVPLSLYLLFISFTACVNAELINRSL